MQSPTSRRTLDSGTQQIKGITTIPYGDRPRLIDRPDSDRSISTTVTDLFDMDPLRRDSATTVDSYDEPLSPMAFDASSLARSATLRPVIVRGSRSDEQRKTVAIDLERKDGDVDGVVTENVDQPRDHKSVAAQGKHMLEHGIENLATKFRSFGFPGSKQATTSSSDSELNRPSSASGSGSRLRLGSSDTSSPSAPGLSPSKAESSSGNPSSSTGPSLFTSRFRSGNTESHLPLPHSHHHQHPQLPHLESDITPRAEFPPSLKSHSPGSTTETAGSPTAQRKFLRYSSTNEEDTDGDDPGPSSSSRNSTIRRKRDPTARKSLLLSRDKSSGRPQTEIVEPSRKGSAGGGYFPDVEQLKKKAKQERDAEKARKKSEALAKRARASALATFATSPRSASSFAFRSTSDNFSRDQNGNRTGIDSPSESENSGTDEMETPWPSSARHGDTPLGLEHEMIKSSRASSIKERMSSMGSIHEHRRSPFHSRKNSLDRKSSSEILTDEDEVLQAGTGCAISIPLAPPPGYPLYSPSIGSDMSERPWMRPASYASSSANASPPTGLHPAVISTQSIQQLNDKTQYDQYFGVPGSMEAHAMSRDSSASGSGPDADGLRRSGDRFDLSPQGLSMSRSTSNSCCSSVTSASGIGASDSPYLHTDPVSSGSSPFEGKITIDTGHDRYIISVGEMIGFSLEDITIAVKSMNRSISSSSSVPRMPLVQQKSVDATSIHSHSSVRSTSSLHGLDRATVPRTSSPDIVSEGKVLHLIADRWEDSAHFERRITFGKDADFSNGVKAKFDGQKLVIEVARRAHRPPPRPAAGRASLPPDPTGANHSPFSSEAFRTPKNLPTQRHHSIAF